MTINPLQFSEDMKRAEKVYAEQEARHFQDFFDIARDELTRAKALHPPLHSLHEAYAVILEEVREFETEVFKKQSKRDKEAVKTELIQIAAMCGRAFEDLGL